MDLENHATTTYVEVPAHDFIYLVPLVICACQVVASLRLEWQREKLSTTLRLQARDNPLLNDATLPRLEEGRNAQYLS